MPEIIEVDHVATQGLKPNMLSLYETELYFLAKSIQKALHELFSSVKPTAEGEKPYSKIDAPTHAIIHGLLSKAASIRKLISTPDKKFDGETDRRHALRIYRSSKLAEYFADIDLAELKKTKVRNVLEHFDEYLDEAIIKQSDSASRTHDWVVYNFILSSDDSMKPLPLGIRLYHAGRRVYYHMGHEADLGKLYQEVSDIVNKLEAIDSFMKTDAEGALILVIN